MQALPSFKAAITDTLSADEVASMRGSGGKIKDRVRTKRAEYLAQNPKKQPA